MTKGLYRVAGGISRKNTQSDRVKELLSVRKSFEPSVKMR